MAPCRSAKGLILLFYLQLCVTPSIALGLTQCMDDMIICAQDSSNCTLGISNVTALSLLRTSQGQNVTSPDTATALSYAACTTYCASGQESFSWTSFSQGYAAWLLPYLALVSQLPFGARRRMGNLMSVVLTLGSPTLAAYSLYMTLLSERWVNDQLFAGLDYPSAKVRQSVVHVLASLQQVPLRIHPGEFATFESLVVHPDNDIWWNTFARELGYSHKWSIASATSIVWVIVAYILNASNSLSNVANTIYTNGEGTASGMLWLLPIVVGWLVLSPRCNYDCVHDAYNRANERAVVVDSDDSRVTSIVDANFGLTISPSPDRLRPNGIASPDELQTPPVFNYARVFSWYRNVYLTSLFYRTAWSKSRKRIGIDGKPIPGNVRSDVPRGSREGTRKQIIEYSLPSDRERSVSNLLWPPRLIFNMVISSFMALFLHLGTTCAAILANWYTPSVGLGCRSLAYITYAMLSTAIWALLVSSSALGYYGHHLVYDQPVPDLERVVRSSALNTPSGSHKIPYDPTIFMGENGSAIPMVDIQVLNDDAKGGDTKGEDVSLFTDLDECSSIRTTSARCSRRQILGHALMRIADWLRWIGKALAIVSAIGVIANSVFQYAGVYSNCYCNARLDVLGSYAFDVFNPNASDIELAKKAWIGGFVFAAFCCSAFVFSMYLVRDSLST